MPVRKYPICGVAFLPRSSAYRCVACVARSSAPCAWGIFERALTRCPLGRVQSSVAFPPFSANTQFQDGLELGFLFRDCGQRRRAFSTLTFESDEFSELVREASSRQHLRADTIAYFLLRAAMTSSPINRLTLAALKGLSILIFAERLRYSLALGENTPPVMKTTRVASAAFRSESQA